MYFSDIDSVIPLCRSAIKILDTSKLDSTGKARYEILNIKAQSLNNIGAVFYNKGEVNKAIDYYYEGLKLREASADKMGIAESLNNLGLVYKSQGNIEKAIENYQRSLKLYEEVKYLKGQATAIGNIGVLYASENKNDTALEYLFRGLKLQESTGNKRGIAEMQNNIGTILLKQNKSGEALKYCTKSLDVLTEIGDKEDIAKTLYIIAQIEFSNNNYAKAIEYGNKALQLSKESDFTENVMNTAKLMYEIYNEQKKWNDALTMHVLYFAMHDSVNSQENRKEVIQKEFQYDFDKRETDLKAAQEKKDLISEAENKRQKIFIWLAFIIAIATGTIAILVTRSLKTTRKQKIIIEEQKNLVELKNKDILDSITYAKRLQDAILPALSTVKQQLPESFVFYKPKDIVAGDFYWMQQSGNSTLIAACDCTGHGVPGAMVSVVCSNALNRAVKEFNITDPGKILDKTRELVIDTFQKSGSEVKDGMDISLCSILPSSGGAKILWAGANSPLWYLQKGEVNEIVADKQPIGVQDGHKDFTTHTLTLDKGDVLYMFTDGYIDQFGGPKGKKYKSKLFREFIKSITSKNMEEQKNMLNRTFEDWKGNYEQTDDVCVIGIRV